MQQTPALHIVGPTAVREAMSEALENRGDMELFEEARRRVVVAMKKALDIPRS
ncbi:hypothetical protein [Agromyces seonyuensis]|uniref:Uncharacterized protein n=1 Tax=Agromyces seonyuensis TaxID=2662446 RepID=A0A6I4P2D2_9MICO|nr:hypothetical protein [Agromyces seonyuensis]MWB98229.1 hypothetical protein [Agromyces seonyuensis]